MAANNGGSSTGYTCNGYGWLYFYPPPGAHTCFHILQYIAARVPRGLLKGPTSIAPAHCPSYQLLVPERHPVENLALGIT